MTNDDMDDISSQKKAIHLFHHLFVAGHDRVLATCTGPYELRVPYSSVVYESGGVDIFIGALSRLVVGREAPGVGLAVLANNNGVLRANSTSDNVVEARNDSRVEENLGLSIALEDLLIVIDSVELAGGYTGLGAVAAAPYEDVAARSKCNVVMRTSFNGDNVFAFKAVNDLGSKNASVVFSGILGMSSLAVVVGTPGPDVAVFGNCEAVVITTRNLGNSLAWSLDRAVMESDAVGLERFDQGALSDTTTELILLSIAPCIYAVILVERNNVVRSASNLGDLGDAINVDWSLGGVDIAAEAQDAFVFLCRVRSC